MLGIPIDLHLEPILLLYRCRTYIFLSFTFLDEVHDDFPLYNVFILIFVTFSLASYIQIDHPSIYLKDRYFFCLWMVARLFGSLKGNL